MKEGLKAHLSQIHSDLRRYEQVMLPPDMPPLNPNISSTSALPRGVKSKDLYVWQEQYPPPVSVGYHIAFIASRPVHLHQ